SSITCFSWPTAASSPRGRRPKSCARKCRSSRSSCRARSMAPCRSISRRQRIRPTLASGRRPDMAGLTEPLQRLGRSVNERIQRLGFAARFFAYMLLHSGTALRRFHLTIREIYFAGVLSLIIILVSGLFVGMVLGLQGYETLQRYGSSE